MTDNFYDRLDFYRMLNAGMTNLAEIAVALQVSVRTLQRWRASYDADRGLFGGRAAGVDVHSTLRIVGLEAVEDVCADDINEESASDPSERSDDRGEIISAMRRVALDGNVPAAKLLLAEYAESVSGEAKPGEVLTVEKAVELLREWMAEERRDSG